MKTCKRQPKADLTELNYKGIKVKE